MVNLQALGLAVLMARTGLAPPAAKPVQLPPFSEVRSPRTKFYALYQLRTSPQQACMSVKWRQVNLCSSLRSHAASQHVCHGTPATDLLLVALL